MQRSTLRADCPALLAGNLPRSGRRVRLPLPGARPVLRASDVNRDKMPCHQKFPRNQSFARPKRVFTEPACCAAR